MKTLTRVDWVFITILISFAVAAVGLQAPTLTELKARNHDNQVSMDLTIIGGAIDGIVADSGKLPDNLKGLNIQGDTASRIDSYEYVAKDDAYELCAQFSTDTQRSENKSDTQLLAYDYKSSYVDYYSHDKGRVCFTNTIETYGSYHQGIDLNADDKAINLFDKPDDSAIRSQVDAAHTLLEAYYAEHGSYPTVTQFYDAQWVETNLSTDGNTSSTTPPTLGFSYIVNPYPCKNSTTDPCESYTLSVYLSDGTRYEKKSVE